MVKHGQQHIIDGQVASFHWVLGGVLARFYWLILGQWKNAMWQAQRPPHGTSQRPSQSQHSGTKFYGGGRGQIRDL